MKKNTFCSYCGKKFPEPTRFPMQCSHCKEITYINPIPVCVMIIPCQGGILGVRRGIEPGLGMPALPGGFVDGGESWQEAGAREAWEEIQVKINPKEIREFIVQSTEDKRLIIIFGITKEIDLHSQVPFAPSKEAQERLVLSGKEKLAFPLHEMTMNRYFLKKEI